MDSDGVTVVELVAECERVLVRSCDALAEWGAPLDVRREARALVADVAGESRAWPASQPTAVLSPELAARVREAALRRAAGEPLAYCTGTAAFRHLVLAVDRRVLIPRPETEMLVELVLERVLQRVESRAAAPAAAVPGPGAGAAPSSPPGADSGLAIDVGTGSGAIALALASEGRFARVIGTDLSADALTVARANAARCAGQLRVPVEFREGDALAPVRGERATVIVANPPYISPDETDAVAASVREWEPHLALFADGDGMAVIAAIVAGSAGVLEPGGLLALEVDARRADRAAQLVRDDARFGPVEVVRDLAGRERFVLAALR